MASVTINDETLKLLYKAQGLIQASSTRNISQNETISIALNDFIDREREGFNGVIE